MGILIIVLLVNNVFIRVKDVNFLLLIAFRVRGICYIGKRIIHVNVKTGIMISRMG